MSATLTFKNEADAQEVVAAHPGATMYKSARGGRWVVALPVVASAVVAAAAKEAAVAAVDALQATKSVEAAPLDVWTLGTDIMTRVIPPQQYAIKPYFPLAAATGLSGQGKIGKSFLLLALMLSVAGGRPCLGCEVTQGDVWYFSAEDKPARVMERAQSILKEFTDEERARAIKHFRCIDAVGRGLFFVATAYGAAQITPVCKQIAKTVGKAVLVVVDTVSRINPLSENSNEGMALVVSAAEVIASLTGAATVLAHHTGKSQARGGETDMYAGRGASSFGDNCRSVLTLSRAAEAQVRTFDERTQEQQRLDNVRVLTHSASSYGREAAPVYLLRRDDGTLTKLNPVTDLLTPLHDWLRAKGLTTFTQRMLLRNHVKEIWSPTPSRAEIERFITHAVATGEFVSTGKAQGGGEHYRLAPGTLENIEAHDARVIHQTSDEEWLNGPQ